MRGFFFAACLLLPLVSQAANPVDIKSLYAARSRTPGALMPFLVSGTAVTSPNSIVSFSAQAADTDCRAMRDPFNGYVILVKCAGISSAVTLKVQVVSGSQMINANFAAFPVAAATDLPPINPTDPGGVSPQVQAGRQLFSSRCNGCHNPPEVLRGRTASQITTAITNSPHMNGTATDSAPKVDLRGVLSATELDNIAAYLGSL